MAKNPLGGFAPGSMLTPVQIALLARKHWKNWKQVQNAVQIALRESGGSSRAHNPKPPDDSYGLWQLNFYGGQKSNFSPALAQDPEASTKYAHQLFQSSGWDPWISPEYRMTDEIRQKALAAVRQAKKQWKQGGGDPNNVTPTVTPTQFAGSNLTDFNPILSGLMENINAFSAARQQERMTGQDVRPQQPFDLVGALANLRSSGLDGGVTSDPDQPGVRVSANPQTTAAMVSGTPFSGRQIQAAKSQLGDPYSFGSAAGRSDWSNNPSSFDCSGIYAWSIAQASGGKIRLPAYTYDLMRLGKRVTRKNMRAGDAVFFNNGAHMGIYLGNGKFLQAPRTGDVVKISNLSDRSDFYMARRHVNKAGKRIGVS